MERNIKTKTKLEKFFFGKPKKNRTLLALKLENSILKNGKKNRTLLPLKLENSVLKNDKKTNIIFWERHKSLFLFCGMMTCRDEFFQLNHEQDIGCNFFMNSIDKKTWRAYD